MGTFAEYLPGLFPTFLRGRWGRAFGRAFGLVTDVCLAGAKAAAKVGFVDLAPSDALPYLLADANLEGLPGETTDGQRGRVAVAFDTWELAGTHAGLQLALTQLGVTGTFRRWPEWAPDLPPDTHPEFWATWHCTIRDHGWTDDGTWGDPGTWGDGGTWDSSAPAADVAQMRRLLRAQMNARDRGFVRLVLAADVDFWEPATPWDNGVWSDSSTLTHIDIEV